MTNEIQNNLAPALRKMDHVASVTTPFDKGGERFISQDGKIGYAEIQFDVQANDVPVNLASDMRSLVKKANTDTLQIELGGSMFTDATQPASELIGILAAVVILLIAFGSVLAMGLPIMTALFGIGTGLAIVTILARFTDVPSFAPQVTAMIGIGVGIDYALFISTRYREALHEGMQPEQAVVHAIDTSGRAVLFAGGTVVISLLGLFVIGLAFIRGLSIGAAIAVLLVMARRGHVAAGRARIRRLHDRQVGAADREEAEAAGTDDLGALEPHGPEAPVADRARRIRCSWSCSPSPRWASASESPTRATIRPSSRPGVRTTS